MDLEEKLAAVVKDREAWDELMQLLDGPISQRVMKNIEDSRTFAMEFPAGSKWDLLYRKALGIK